MVRDLTSWARSALRWRKMAEEARTIADAMRNGRSKRTMNNIADDYDALATGAEARAAQVPKSDDKAPN
jgi:hypothetical protein